MALRGGSLRATSSSVRLKDLVRRDTLREKTLTAEHEKAQVEHKPLDPHQAAGARPKSGRPLRRSSSVTSDEWRRAEVTESQTEKTRDQRADSKQTRAAAGRSSVRNPPPEPEPKPPHPHQAAGARPKTGRPLRKSSSVTSEERKCEEVTESQKEKTKRLQREQRADSKQTREVNRALSPPCLYCKGDHAFPECLQFAKYPERLRLEVVRNSGLCFGCLGQGHFSRDCPARIVCSICSKDHPRILHIKTRDEMFEEMKEGLKFFVLSRQPNKPRP
ncbi:hypothetical protein NL108_016266 [Boleophthalmus pectinirostris]|nr:hypothetical protein NL108_016266 [Boleophthalmus pectinirostris]